MTADAITARLAAGQNGSLSRKQLRTVGLSDEQVDCALERRVLLPTHSGVYRHAAVPATWHGRVHAGVLAAGGDALASHRTAAKLQHLDKVPRFRPEVTTTALDLPLHHGVLVHRTNLLDPIDRTVVNGIPCTAIWRTLLDLGAVLPYELVENAVQDAIIRKLVTYGQLYSVLERVGGRGRRGTAKLRVIVRYALPDARVTTMLEHKLNVLITESPIPAPEIQFPFRCDDGRPCVFDFAWPDRRIAVEPDGHRWHSTSTQLRKDLARRRSIQASGWQLYSYGWSDVVELAAQTRAELCRVLRV